MDEALNSQYLRRLIHSGDIDVTFDGLDTWPQFLGVKIRSNFRQATYRPKRPRAKTKQVWFLEHKYICAHCRARLNGDFCWLLQLNYCARCERNLFDEDDEELLSGNGAGLYWPRVRRYSDVGAKFFSEYVEGNEMMWGGGLGPPGYHRDHMFSISDCFEHDVPEMTAASPCNIAIISAQENIAKGRKSSLTLEQLTHRHDRFLADHPEWPKVARKHAKWSSNVETYMPYARRVDP